MKVILIKDVKKQGKKDDIINVSDGYANNYLIKNNLAVPYTTGSKQKLDDEKNEKKLNEELLICQKMEIAKLIEKNSITFKVKTGKEDKMFGKISTKQILEKLKEKNIIIDKNDIVSNNLCNIGIYNVEIRLHKRVKCILKVNIVKE